MVQQGSSVGDVLGGGRSLYRRRIQTLQERLVIGIYLSVLPEIDTHHRQWCLA